jgi:hypothetical protein
VATPSSFFLNSARALVIAAVGLACGQAAFAQDVSRYRVYALESTLAAVISASGAGATEARTLHERPARIQELEWRAPYVNSGTEFPDPVEAIAFTFYNDALYQLIVSYDRDRTDGLTNRDLIDSLSATYGEPGLPSARSGTSRPAAALRDAVVLAQWETAGAALTLLRDPYSPEFQVVLISKPLNALARSAIREAVRLDTIDAPRRELEQRRKQAADASAARDKTRATNKAAFRP